MLDAFTWQTAPFERLVSEISPERDLSRTPVFQAVINVDETFQNAKSAIKGLEVETVSRKDPAAQFDISLDFDDNGDSVAASFNYNIDLFNENTIIHLVAHYQNLLRDMLKKIELPISELEMLTPSELKRIVFSIGIIQIQISHAIRQFISCLKSRLLPRPIPRHWILWVRILTFQEVNDRSNKLAHVLLEMGVEPEVHVGLYVERSSRNDRGIIGRSLRAEGGCSPFRPSFLLKNSYHSF